MESKTMGVMIGSVAALAGFSFLMHRSGSLAEAASDWMSSIGGRDPKSLDTEAEGFEMSASYYERKSQNPMSYRYASDPEGQKISDIQKALDYRKQADRLRREADSLRRR